MKTRAEAAAFIREQLPPLTGEVVGSTITGRGKGGRHHYGRQELRDLLDFIYGGPPTDKSEKICGGPE